MDRPSAMNTLWAALLLAGLLVTPARAETVTYLHTDLLGSVVLETDQNRNVVARYEYEPYGLPRQAIADQPGYTGHVHDAGSGLVYMQQRYYDPEVGRFLSVDPVGVDTGTGGNFNRYGYGNNNPYRYVDPDGRWAEDVLIGGPSLALGLSSFHNNVSEGNFLAAVVDAAGIVLDSLAIAVPGAPGGVGLGIKAARGLDAAPVSGTAQVTRSGGQETAHAATSQRIANEQAARTDAASVHLNQTVRTITSGDANSAVRPDVATVRQDGKVDVVEVLSPGQDAAASAKKYSDALGDRAGSIKCVAQDRC
jgi:RHS repeat-associated protein